MPRFPPSGMSWVVVVLAGCGSSAEVDGEPAALPEGATETGYTSGDVSLWLDENDGEAAVFLVSPNGIERWPRAEQLACE